MFRSLLLKAAQRFVCQIEILIPSHAPSSERACILATVAGFARRRGPSLNCRKSCDHACPLGFTPPRPHACASGYTCFTVAGPVG